jgi:hypothetical protein
MRNVTVTLDDETARWARIEAAKRDMSVSALIRELLGEHMRRETSYHEAMRRFLGRKPRVISSGPYPKRDELYDRGRLR